MKYLILLGFVSIIASLGAAMFFMLRGGKKVKAPGDSPSYGMAWSLALRVGLSIALFACVLIAWKLGYIQPTGIKLQSI
jgi:Protein of unknown function (DUF2909)